MKFILATLSFLMVAMPLNGGEPTHQNVRYDSEFERSVMDLWLPKVAEPTPIIVFFHGGGFKTGDKTQISFKKEFLSFVDKGFAFVSVGYPLLGDNGKTNQTGSVNYDRILLHTERAIEFLKNRSKEYNLDTSRLAVAGTSAGALISEHLTYHAKLGVSLCIAIEQPFEVNKVIEIIDKGEPPIFLFTRSGIDNSMHNPSYARMIDQHCKKTGVPSYLYGSKQSGLPEVPDGRGVIDHVFQVTSNIWKRLP